MSHSLRFEGETDDAFRQRVERTAIIAQMPVNACLANKCMRGYIADPDLPFYTPESVRAHPTVRIEYEEAIAIGGLGETLRITASKHWGDGPYVMPLEPDDWFHASRITYLYRENSRYNQRFEQRRQMKALLGRRYRKLVGEAQCRTKGIFVEHLTKQEARAIREILALESGKFWRAAKGKEFVTLPPMWVQGELFED